MRHARAIDSSPRAIDSIASSSTPLTHTHSRAAVFEHTEINDEHWALTRQTTADATSGANAANLADVTVLWTSTTSLLCPARTHDGTLPRLELPSCAAHTIRRRPRSSPTAGDARRAKAKLHLKRSSSVQDVGRTQPQRLQARISSGARAHDSCSGVASASSAPPMPQSCSERRAPLATRRVARDQCVVDLTALSSTSSTTA